MKETFKFIIDSRKAFIKLIDELSEEDLNKIPEGFNNNIIWNFGHIVVSTQILCYIRTGIWAETSRIKFVDAYKKDTKPTYHVSKSEIEELKALAISTIKDMEEHNEQGLFNKIEPYSTATFGEQLNSFKDVLVTTIGHDNLHYGYALAQKRIINI